MDEADSGEHLDAGIARSSAAAVASGHMNRFIDPGLSQPLCVADGVGIGATA